MRKTEQLTELRCAKCGKLLARGEGMLQIKCRSCKTVNHFHGLAPKAQNADERQEVLTNGDQ